VNCRECRAEMCTDGLLSKLRCADCRQIKLEHVCHVLLKAGLICSVGYVLVSLIMRRADPVDDLSLEDEFEPRAA
jgi:hypothetical protein